MARSPAWAPGPFTEKSQSVTVSMELGGGGCQTTLAASWPVAHLHGVLPLCLNWGVAWAGGPLGPRLSLFSIQPPNPSPALPTPTLAGTSLLTAISSSGAQGIYPHGWACSQPWRTVALQLLQVQTRSIQICRAGVQGCAPALLQNAFSSLLSQKYSSMLNAAKGMAKFWGTSWLMLPPADPGLATEVRPAAASLLAGWSTPPLLWISGEGLGAVSPTCPFTWETRWKEGPRLQVQSPGLLSDAGVTAPCWVGFGLTMNRSEPVSASMAGS